MADITREAVERAADKLLPKHRTMILALRDALDKAEQERDIALLNCTASGYDEMYRIAGYFQVRADKAVNERDEALEALRDALDGDWGEAHAILAKHSGDTND